MQPNWQIKKLDELSTTELYKVLKLRNEVFVVEQNCVYLDTDDKDFTSLHLCGWMNETLVAYCRILPPGISYDATSIGRVATHIEHRKFGYGRQMMQFAIEKIRQLYPNEGITISAQVYLQKFYESLGFVATSESYLEDDIPHIEMHLSN